MRRILNVFLNVFLNVVFFEATEAVSKITSSLIPNRQINWSFSESPIHVVQQLLRWFLKESIFEKKNFGNKYSSNLLLSLVSVFPNCLYLSFFRTIYNISIFCIWASHSHFSFFIMCGQTINFLILFDFDFGRCVFSQVVTAKFISYDILSFVMWSLWEHWPYDNTNQILSNSERDFCYIKRPITIIVITLNAVYCICV